MSGWESLLETYSSTPSNHSGGAVTPEWVIDGLVKRGLPAHMAEGFAYNFADESNFDPGINEITPLVKGSRGGFGLYQLTGPRRRQYESYVAKRGLKVDDPDAQLDFLMQELNTTEKSAFNALQQTSTAGEAGAVIVNKFLRPHESHRKKRAAKYLSGKVSFGTPSEVPQTSAPAEMDFSRLWLGNGDS